MANVMYRKGSLGAIYGNTLKHLVESGGNAGFAAAALTSHEFYGAIQPERAFMRQCRCSSIESGGPRARRSISIQDPKVRVEVSRTAPSVRNCQSSSKVLQSHSAHEAI